MRYGGRGSSPASFLCPYALCVSRNTLLLGISVNRGSRPPTGVSSFQQCGAPGRGICWGRYIGVGGAFTSLPTSEGARRCTHFPRWREKPSPCVGGPAGTPLLRC